MATSVKTVISNAVDVSVLMRMLEEGYGPGAWHGADLKAAIADVSDELAFWRPAAGRHNIAEIALHHAYCVRSVRGQLSGAALEPFVLNGEDWFELNDAKKLSWERVRKVVKTEQQKLTAVMAEMGAGKVQSPVSVGEHFDLVLGITCHAIYHAGQVQLIKRFHAK